MKKQLKMKLLRNFVIFIQKVAFKMAEIIFVKCIKIAIRCFNFTLAICEFIYMTH